MANNEEALVNGYPLFTSTKATVDETRFIGSVEEQEAVPKVFLDGVIILLPESEIIAIELLYSNLMP